MPEFPARVHPILARDSKQAIIIRRGPSKSVCTIGWDREEDSFQVGQWLRGRIYERRSDLSPDGRHFIYFAMNGKWSSPTGGSWTAISRAPYLKAIGLWAKGDCWNGGGLFLSNRKFWLNQCLDEHQGHFPCGDDLTATAKPPSEGHYGNECPGVYYLRLQRDGWTILRQKQAGDDSTVFVKPLAHGWALEKKAHATTEHPEGRGCYHDAHRLVHEGRQILLDYPDWEWADLDVKRLVWVKNGQLFAGRITAKGVAKTRMLYDFNDMKFEALAAPY